MKQIDISPLIANNVVGGLLDANTQESSNARLTARQREVLRLLAQGKSMKKIAETLGITSRTVGFHKYRMMKKLHFKNNAQIVRYAIHHGMISS
jgi:DNA-binding NarL/FixJ family response regulator